MRGHLELIPRICAGGPEAGEIGALEQPERFRWLASPRSTVVQMSPVHSGLCSDPQAALDDLFAKMVDALKIADHLTSSPRCLKLGVYPLPVTILTVLLKTVSCGSAGTLRAATHVTFSAAGAMPM